MDSICDICGYSLRLTQYTSDIEQNNANLIEQVLANPSTVENFLPVNVQLLTSSVANKALNRTIRTKLLKLIPDTSLTYYHKCKNPECNFTRVLKPGTVIYSEQSHVKHLTQDYSRFKHSKILPQTAKYVCPNTNCKSKQNSNLRSASFFRVKQGLQLVYMCNICDHYWLKE